MYPSLHIRVKPELSGNETIEHHSGLAKRYFIFVLCYPSFINRSSRPINSMSSTKIFCWSSVHFHLWSRFIIQLFCSKFFCFSVGKERSRQVTRQNYCNKFDIEETPMSISIARSMSAIKRRGLSQWVRRVTSSAKRALLESLQNALESV